MAPIGAASERVVLGRITGIFGTRGWVKVWSYTDPAENILNYRRWQVATGGGWVPIEVLEGQRQGKNIVVHLRGCDDRDLARGYMGAEVAVPREELPVLSADEYYWADLEGLRVVNQDGVELGTVDSLLETGANDVLVVKGERERLIPYLPKLVVTAVDLEQGLLRVDWDPDF
jgi:16S rRNA processing protein RimM